MNIAFFLTPKNEVVTLEKSMSIGQAMEIMEKYRYTSVPVIDSKGSYIGTLSEGDILWYLNAISDKSIQEIKKDGIRKIKRHHHIKAVAISANVESLVQLAAVQAFVPVVDDANTFIGIIKRSDLIQYSTKKMTDQKIALLA